MDSQKHQEAKKVLNKSYGFGAFEDDVSILKKYSHSQKKQQPAKLIPAPLIPAGFNLNHKFDRKFSTNSTEDNSATDSMNVYLKSMTERAQALGEKPLQVESVFDLMKPEDRDFLKKKHQDTVVESETVKKVIETSKREELERNAQEKKTKRYEAFVSYVKKNYKGEY